MGLQYSLPRDESYQFSVVNSRCIAAEARLHLLKSQGKTGDSPELTEALEYYIQAVTARQEWEKRERECCDCVCAG
jgi:hypothetical protein